MRREKGGSLGELALPKGGRECFHTTARRRRYAARAEPDSGSRPGGAFGPTWPSCFHAARQKHGRFPLALPCSPCYSPARLYQEALPMTIDDIRSGILAAMKSGVAAVPAVRKADCPTSIRFAPSLLSREFRP